MKKVSLYPFNKEALFLIQNSFFPTEWKISAGVVPRGLMYQTSDGISKSQMNDFNMFHDFDESLEFCDTVFFMESDIIIDNETIKNNIFKSLSAKKEVFCSIKIDNKILLKLNKESDKVQSNFHYITDEVSFNSIVSDEMFNEKKTPYMKEIQTPILAFLSTVDAVNKIQYYYYASKFFQKLGYKIALVMPKRYASLGEAYPVPSFIFDEVNELKKVILFNNYLHKIEETAKPDLFIIAIPGGILPINKVYLNKFGITAFEMTRAFECDSCILCTHFVDAKEEYYQRMIETVKYRFSCEIDAFIIDNTHLDFFASGYPDEIDILEIGDDAFRKMKFDVKKYSQNIYIPNELDSLLHGIYEKLTSEIFRSF